MQRHLISDGQVGCVDGLCWSCALLNLEMFLLMGVVDAVNPAYLELCS